MKLRDFKDSRVKQSHRKNATVEPLSGMRIKWQNIYYPLGEWINDSGDVVKIDGGFRADHGNINIIVMMHAATCGGGHGELSITSNIPSFINEDNLDVLSIGDGFITIK